MLFMTVGGRARPALPGLWGAQRPASPHPLPSEELCQAVVPRPLSGQQASQMEPSACTPGLPRPNWLVGPLSLPGLPCRRAVPSPCPSCLLQPAQSTGACLSILCPE